MISWQLTIEIFQKHLWQMPEMSSTFHAIVVLIVLIHEIVIVSSTYVFVIHMDWKRNFFTMPFLNIWEKKRQRRSLKHKWEINIYVFSPPNLRSTYIAHIWKEMYFYYNTHISNIYIWLYFSTTTIIYDGINNLISIYSNVNKSSIDPKVVNCYYMNSRNIITLYVL